MMAYDVSIKLYDPSFRQGWDDFVDRSKNGTFLFKRAYMEYHRNRFNDLSLIFTYKKRIVAILAANKDYLTLHSHEGLTYGGFITDDTMTLALMLTVFDALLYFARSEKIDSIIYKCIPSIYWAMPADEDKYCLFRKDATLVRRDILSVVDWRSPGPVQERRRRGATKARKADVRVERSDRWQAFWNVLASNLKDRHGTAPVHTIEEIQHLSLEFPESICLYVATKNQTILAGVVLYCTRHVIHAQYIASTDEGKAIGALDYLFSTTIENAIKSEMYFDFGTSNENSGRILNYGLIEQKEGFGARSIAHDFYRISTNCA